MAYARRRGHPARHPAAAVAVIGLHVLLGYALVTGTAHRVIERLQAPVQARIVDEPKHPPPPPPPPEMLPVPLLPPPPAYVPPPEVRVAPPPRPAPTITTTTVAPPPAPVIVPAAPPVAAAAPAPPAPPARPAEPPRVAQPARLDVAHCEKPMYPIAALRAGAAGSTLIRFAIDASGRVQRATLTRASGTSLEHRQMDRAAIEALSRCAFKPGLDENGHAVGAQADVEYVWRVED